MKRGLDMARSYNDHESSQETGPESPNSPTFNAVISSHSPKRRYIEIIHIFDSNYKIIS